MGGAGVMGWAALLPGLLASALPAATIQADPAFSSCPGSEALSAAVADVRWTPVASQLEEHRQFRSKLGVPMPDGNTRILWFSRGGDLDTTMVSVIATRDDDGIWHVDGVGTSGMWIKDVLGRPLKRLDYDLSRVEGERLDRLMAEPCLVHGPRFVRRLSAGVGATWNNLEIGAPDLMWVGSWVGASTAQEQAIVSLLLSHQ